MRALLLLLSFTVLFASTACAQSFRVATYNLNWGNRRGDQVLDAIATAKPDLICFQETTVQSEAFLRGKLADDYPYFHSVGHDGRLAEERFAFASKMKLADIVYTPPTAGLFGTYSATFDLEGQPVRILNVHLSPMLLKRGQGIAGLFNALSKAESIHKREIEAVAKLVELKIPTVIAGDFNSISTSTAPTTLVLKGFVDSFAALHDDADAQPTWTWPTRPLPISLRIDYIFHTGQLAATDSEIVQRAGSDHSLVVAELRIVPDGG